MPCCAVLCRGRQAGGQAGGAAAAAGEGLRAAMAAPWRHGEDRLKIAARQPEGGARRDAPRSPAPPLGGPAGRAGITPRGAGGGGSDPAPGYREAPGHRAGEGALWGGCTGRAGSGPARAAEEEEAAGLRLGPAPP